MENIKKGIHRLVDAFWFYSFMALASSWQERAVSFPWLYPWADDPRAVPVWNHCWIYNKIGSRASNSPKTFLTIRFMVAKLVSSIKKWNFSLKMFGEKDFFLIFVPDQASLMEARRIKRWSSECHLSLLKDGWVATEFDESQILMESWGQRCRL